MTGKVAVVEIERAVNLSYTCFSESVQKIFDIGSFKLRVSAEFKFYVTVENSVIHKQTSV